MTVFEASSSKGAAAESSYMHAGLLSGLGASQAHILRVHSRPKAPRITVLCLQKPSFKALLISKNWSLLVLYF